MSGICFICPAPYISFFTTLFLANFSNPFQTLSCPQARCLSLNSQKGLLSSPSCWTGFCQFEFWTPWIQLSGHIRVSTTPPRQNSTRLSTPSFQYDGLQLLGHLPNLALPALPWPPSPPSLKHAAHCLLNCVWLSRVFSPLSSLCFFPAQETQTVPEI